MLLNDSPLPNRSIGVGETLHSIQAVFLHEDWDDGIQRIIDRLLSIVGDDGRPYPRAHASRALVRIGEPTVPYLLTALEAPHGRLREAALSTLTEMGEAASIAVTAALASEHEAVRIGAAEVLRVVGGPKQDSSPSALPGLLRMLASADKYEASAAADALGALGDRPPSPLSSRPSRTLTTGVPAPQLLWVESLRRYRSCGQADWPADGPRRYAPLCRSGRR